jgi:hypothetical protein
VRGARRFAAPVGLDDCPVQDHVRQPVAAGSVQRLVQVRSLSGQEIDDLVHIPAGRRPADLVISGQGFGAGAVAEPPQPQHRLPEAGELRKPGDVVLTKSGEIPIMIVCGTDG